MASPVIAGRRGLDLFSRWGGGIADITGDKRSNSIVDEKGRNYWFGLVYFSVVLDELISAAAFRAPYSM